MAAYTVGYLVGSLAAASINRKLAKALARVAPNELELVEISFRDNAFARKPSAVIGTSPGAIGTAVAQQHLRSVLSFCNSPQMNSPEAYIQFKPGLIGDDGQVSDESTAEFLTNYMTELHGFIARVYTVLPRGAAQAAGTTERLRH